MKRDRFGDVHIIIRKGRVFGVEGRLDTPLGTEKQSSRTQDTRDFLQKVWNNLRLMPTSSREGRPV